ncbi:NtaA/DmoA family FMN-dependent monooxygenase [Microbacterium sp. kSW2-24]|uniref:NtaA/DmoA family FMN-dependent monooxygenase n=1 Tax=Microbacterium galbinum TaxID=2851646 RepID=UPI001FFCF82E|nr:NtaA/DmoA family FMN-dependent monooxygenase [Microbacterium galbinum]MCK2024198.1 NtaA/DmoA family FMN-dependent monooxygenase [Microbacterium galbinum]
MTEPLIIGAMVRTLGAYPSGWRHPGAHRDPAGDAAVLRRIAELGEEAGLDYLFFGDWLATGPDLEFRDPYLLARIDPLSAVLFLAGVTSRIGLIATVNTTYADPYATARALASLDVLTGGRAGVNLVTGVEPRAAGNHGRDAHADNENRYDRAEEFVTALDRLWDSWSADAWIADADRGVLIDPDGLREAGVEGAHVRVTGPLNVARPPQGRLPIVHAGTSPRSRALAATEADLALIAAPSLADAVATRTGLRLLAAEAGRSPEAVRVIAPVLPVVGETDAEAQAIVARLLSLVPLAEEHQRSRPAFPVNRSVTALADALGVAADDPLRSAAFDAPVTAAEAERLGEEGAALIERLARIAGLEISGSARGTSLTWRHLVAAHAVPGAFVVGSAASVADHFETWRDAGAADGFNVLSAFQPAQFEAFTRLAAPELRRRGLLGREGSTLRERLSVTPRVGSSRLVSSGVDA